MSTAALISKRLIVELIGTYLLVISAIAVIILQSVSQLGIAASPALAVMIMILAFGQIADVHLNPAVSFSFFLLQKISLKTCLTYFVAQLIGGAAAGLTMKALFGDKVASETSYGVNQVAPSTSFLLGFTIEVVTTAILLIVIFQTTQNNKSGNLRSAAFVIALTIFILILIVGPIEGACFNPARWFGPAFAGGYWSNWEIYTIAPMLGGALAALIYRQLNPNKASVDRPL